MVESVAARRHGGTASGRHLAKVSSSAVALVTAMMSSSFNVDRPARGGGVRGVGGVGGVNGQARRGDGLRMRCGGAGRGQGGVPSQRATRAKTTKGSLLASSENTISDTCGSITVVCQNQRNAWRGAGHA